MDLSENNIKHVVIWMNQPSYYQTIFFRELTRNGVQLKVLYNSNVAKFRRDLGWQTAGEENFGQRTLSGSWDAIRQVLQHRDAVHLINGLWSIPHFMLASVLLLLTGSRVYFHAEHPDPAMTRAGAWYTFKCWWVRWLMLMAEGLFSIGRRACAYYHRMGVQDFKIVPFMYFTGRPVDMLQLTARAETGQFLIVYVGQFVEWKRVEDILQAVALINESVLGCRLLLLGAGPLAKRYIDLARELGLQDKVQLRGPLPPKHIWRSLPEADVLVLASRFDGWGLTVNEALQSGVPAVCSDECGVAELIRENPTWGIVFASGNVIALAAALRDVARNKYFFRPAQSEVENRIGPVNLTHYFLKHISKSHRSARPVCPLL